MLQISLPNSNIAVWHICDKGKIINYTFDIKLVHLYISEEKWWY